MTLSSQKYKTAICNKRGGEIEKLIFREHDNYHDGIVRRFLEVKPENKCEMRLASKRFKAQFDSWTQ